MNDKQKLAVLTEALQQIRNGKRGVDSETANAALDRICNKESELVKNTNSKLIDILAREVKAWGHCDFMAQQPDGTICSTIGKPSKKREKWIAQPYSSCYVFNSVKRFEVAADRESALVTREAWEERVKPTP